MLKRPTKRKAERNQSPRYTQPDPVLYIQAYEADVVCGSHAHSLALSIDAQHAESAEGATKTRLVKWQPRADAEGSPSPVWVDRYDVRLLLDTPPPLSTGSVPATESSRLSPTGWSDLPSDSEDTFFFSPDEVEDYHREKRRRMIDQGRDERLRALRAEAGEDDNEDEEDVWGGSDEEPDETQSEFMRRTAAHILSSPNPAQLEMRILANHGADKRFAFLRGRWSRAWKITKGRVRLGLEADKAKATEEKEKKAGLGGLAGYGDSDASGEEEEGLGEDRPQAETKEELTARQDEEAVKEARRVRAKEWAEKRRAAKAGGE